MTDEAIHRLTCDVVRVPCDRVLLSPELYQACVERIRSWGPDTRLAKNVATSDVFVRGVSAHRCDALSGMEYALVPKAGIVE